jgi:putative ABC transport system substrate-binding protein
MRYKVSSQKGIGFAVCALLLAIYDSAQAQPSQTFARIGYVFATSPSVAAPRVEAFQQGVRELGYVEGKNIVIEWRYAENESRLASLTAELLHLKVNVIVTGGGVATRSAKEATSTVPVVMTQDTDPVANGFVASLARPGGNITGLSTLAPELSGKRLELLKEIVPTLSRVAVFGNSPNPGTDRC